MQKFIPVCTSKNLDTWRIYTYDYKVDDSTFMYRRYDDEGLFIFKTEVACQSKCDELNRNNEP